MTVQRRACVHLLWHPHSGKHLPLSTTTQTYVQAQSTSDLAWSQSVTRTAIGFFFSKELFDPWASGPFCISYLLMAPDVRSWAPGSLNSGLKGHLVLCSSCFCALSLSIYLFVSLPRSIISDDLVCFWVVLIYNFEAKIEYCMQHPDKQTKRDRDPFASPGQNTLQSLQGYCFTRSSSPSLSLEWGRETSKETERQQRESNPCPSGYPFVFPLLASIWQSTALGKAAPKWCNGTCLVVMGPVGPVDSASLQ